MAAAKKLWTEEELQILREGYPVQGIHVMGQLPGRNRSMITQQARRLGLSAPCDDWSKEELEILFKWYPVDGTGVCRLLPGKSIAAVHSQAQRQGLVCKARWSVKEEEILRQYYPIEGTAAVKRIPGRTRESVRIHARKLGLRYIKGADNSKSSKTMGNLKVEGGIDIMKKRRGMHHLPLMCGETLCTDWGYLVNTEQIMSA